MKNGARAMARGRASFRGNGESYLRSLLRGRQWARVTQCLDARKVAHGVRLWVQGGSGATWAPPPVMWLPTLPRQRLHSSSEIQTRREIAFSQRCVKRCEMERWERGAAYGLPRAPHSSRPSPAFEIASHWRPSASCPRRPAHLPSRRSPSRSCRRVR